MTTLRYEYKNEMRLDVFLSQELKDFSRSKIQKFIKNGEVLVNEKKEKGSYLLRERDIIDVLEVSEKDEIIPQDIKLNIVYEDDYLIVLNKQKGILTHPTANQTDNTLVNALLYHCGENLSNVDGDNRRRGIVHRLDKNTAGLMLVAKTNEAHIELARQIKEKEAVRKYRAVVYGNLEKDFDTISIPLVKNIKDTVKVKAADLNDKNAKGAVTLYKVIERFEGATYVEFELKTGRTHQIRAHMAHLNHPVAGDTLYGSKGFKHPVLSKIKTQEQVLQSYFISFKHPITCDKMEFELTPKEWDKDIITVLNALRENKNE